MYPEGKIAKIQISFSDRNGSSKGLEINVYLVFGEIPKPVKCNNNLITFKYHRKNLILFI